MEKPQRASMHYNQIELDIINKAMDSHKGKMIDLARELSPSMHRTVDALQNKLHMLKFERMKAAHKAQFEPNPPVHMEQLYPKPLTEVELAKLHEKKAEPITPKERNYCIIEFGDYVREGCLTNVTLHSNSDITIHFSSEKL